MKIVFVGLMLLGATSAGGAYAAGAGVPAESSLSKDLSVQSASPVTKKSKTMLSRKSKTSDKVGAIKTDSEAKKPGSVMETPRESADQSVQLRGVRG